MLRHEREAKADPLLRRVFFLKLLYKGSNSKVGVELDVRARPGYSDMLLFVFLY